MKITSENVKNSVEFATSPVDWTRRPYMRFVGDVVILGRTYELSASVSDTAHVAIFRRYSDGRTVLLEVGSSVRLFLREWCEARAKAWVKTPEYAAARVQATAVELDRRAAQKEAAVRLTGERYKGAKKALAETRREQRAFLRKHPEYRKVGDENPS